MIMDPTRWATEFLGMIDEKKLMMQNRHWVAGVLKMARYSLELHMRSMESFQQQMTTLVELSLNQSQVARGQVEAVVKDWMGNFDKAHKMYFEMLEQGFKTLESQLTATETETVETVEKVEKAEKK